MIRRAFIEDAGSIARIIVDAWQSAYVGIIDPDYPGLLKTDKFEKIISANISGNREVIFVYEDEQEIRGFISGRKESGKYDCEVVGLYVSPASQSGGIGRSLLLEM